MQTYLELYIHAIILLEVMQIHYNTDNYLAPMLYQQYVQYSKVTAKFMQDENVAERFYRSSLMHVYCAVSSQLP